MGDTRRPRGTVGNDGVSGNPVRTGYDAGQDCRWIRRVRQLKAVSFPASVALASVAAVVLAAIGLLRARQNVEQVRQWTCARSVSEALKTEVFLFLTRSGPYEGPDAERRLEAEAQRLEHEAGDLQRYTEDMQARTRPLPAVRDVDSYLAVRVRQSQLDGYYQPKARLLLLRRRSRRISPRSVMSSCGSSTAARPVSSAVFSTVARQRTGACCPARNWSASASR